MTRDSKYNSIVHNFETSLEKSLELNHESDWVSFYKRLWPDAVTIVRVDKACTIQTRGIDRMIWLPSGRQITVDEKHRGDWYNDILLETCSVMRNNQEQSIGWALDHNKYCDYVAYSIPCVKKCFFLPFELTKSALCRNLAKWKTDSRCKYPIDSPNNGYKTRNIAVPWEILRQAITVEMQRTFATNLVPLPTPEVGGDSKQLTFEW